ncbi:hypothetical protein [Aquirufa aurantiipilula]
MTTIKQISITNLLLNIENPRFELVGNQREALLAMVNDQADKILNLAKDIVEIGMLNPSELVIVTPSENLTNHFIVLEGNRRVTTLKLLTTPEIISSDNNSFFKKIKPLSDKFQQNPILEISCVIFADSEKANKWIKLKHTGENEGIGIVRWDAQQVARFEERIDGTSPIALQAIDFLRKDVSVDAELKEKLKDVPSSSLDRLLKDKSVQSLIGLSIKDYRLQTNLKRNEVVKGLTKIVTDLIDKKIRVKDIYTKEDREKYVKSFLPSEIPDKKQKERINWELVSASTIQSKPQSSSPQKTNPILKERETLIPKDCTLNITDARLIKIYKELRKLQVNNYENAVGVLFRVFIELSIDTYIDRFPINNITHDTKLKQKVIEVSLHMEQNGVAKKGELKGIRSAVNNQHDMLSMDTFNAYVHNRHLSPAAKSLITSWDNIQVFITKLWQAI